MLSYCAGNPSMPLDSDTKVSSAAALHTAAGRRARPPARGSLRSRPDAFTARAAGAALKVLRRESANWNALPTGVEGTSISGLTSWTVSSALDGLRG
jgi:hypothetical protein